MRPIVCYIDRGQECEGAVERGLKTGGEEDIKITHMYFSYICTHACMHAPTCASISVFVYVRMNMYIHTLTRVCVYV